MSEFEICEECGEEIYPRHLCICDDLVEVQRRIEINSLLALRFDVASYDDYFSDPAVPGAEGKSPQQE